jgi:exopolysaccharide biosynthesis protein
MKKKFVIVNTFLMFAVLFSILFQYVHSYEHMAKQLSEKKCHHKYTSSEEITHQHLNFEDCFVCNFTISNFIASDIHHFEFKKISIPSGYSFFKSREITQFFKGSLFALRAPPIFIV